MKNNENSCCVLKISESPLFDDNSDINVRRYKHDIDEYSNLLEKAIKDGTAFIIEGCEPTDDELIKIRNILEKKGKVKVFRKRKKITGEKYSIKPSVFHTIAVSRIDEEEAENVKKNTCKYIDSLIDDNPNEL